MSIANKLVTVAENVSKVYKAGQKSMIDESKIIEATATAENILVLDDVSEIPHEVSVSVKRKNLMSSPFGEINVENGKTYTISAALKPNVSCDSGSYSLAWYDVDGNWRNMELVNDYSGLRNSSFTFTAGIDGYHDYHIDHYGYTEDMFEYAQLEESVDLSSVTVRVSGKNLFDIKTAPELYYHDYTVEKTDTGFIGTSTAQGETLSTRHGFNIGRYEDLVGKTLTVSSNYSSPTNTDGSPYILVVNTSIQSADNYEFNNSNRQQIAGEKNTSLTFTIPKGLPFDYVCVCFYLSSGKPIKVGDMFEYSNIQIEVGTAATPYEPYIEPITLSLDDEGKATTKSMSPNMTFISSVNGVKITADYHKSYGMQTERDKVWDAIQNYGNRTAYSTGFGYSAWNDTTFRPKYDIRPVGGCGDLFRESKIVDLEGVLQSCGVVLDTSQVTSLNYAFYNSLIKNIPTLNMTVINSAAAGRLYVGQYTTTIRKIVVAETTPWDSLTFRQATNLENLIIEGTIGQNGFNVQWSTNLTHDSLMSIINALKDYSADTSGTEWVVTIGSTNLAKLTSEEQEIARAKGWNIV